MFPRFLAVPIIVLVATMATLDGAPQQPALAAGDPTALFGDGSDGAITFSSNTQFDPPADAVLNSGTSGGTSLTVSGVTGVFQPGDRVLIHQTRGTGAGDWELNIVQSYALGNMTTTTSLNHTYATSGADAAQVLVLPEYTNVTVSSGATLTAKAWNGSKGGIIAFFANGSATIDGTISASGSVNLGQSVANGGGFRGGIGGIQSASFAGYRGEGPAAQSDQDISGDQLDGAGGGARDASNAGGSGTRNGSGGGGAGYRTAGTDGQAGDGVDPRAGEGGVSIGTADLSLLLMGPGGGGGSLGEPTDPSWQGGAGGNGGGIIVLMARSVSLSGSIATVGGAGGSATGSYTGSGGAGAGGSVLIRTETANFGSGQISAVGDFGGTAGRDGGNSGTGRIRVEYCGTINGGVADPPASLEPISCPGILDTDQDGCTDKKENGAVPAQGGQRDYQSFWDFYDVWTHPIGDPIGWERDKVVTTSDILAIALRFGPGTPPAPQDAVAAALTPPAPGDNNGYHAAYDRGLQTGPNPWDKAPPDGFITITDDVLPSAQQFSHNCT